MNLKFYCRTYFTDIVFNHFFDFKGRASRKLFWLFTLNVFVINFILSYILQSFDVIGFIIGMIFSLIMFFPSLGLTVRRLHDINFSGWWVLLGFIPVIGAIALIIFACLPGTEGENKYGNVTVDAVAVEEK